MNLNDIGKTKKRRCCAWDSNPVPQVLDTDESTCYDCHPLYSSPCLVSSLFVLTTCTCSLVSVKQEQVRVFCYSNKKLTRLQQSNFLAGTKLNLHGVNQAEGNDDNTNLHLNEYTLYGGSYRLLFSQLERFPLFYSYNFSRQYFLSLSVEPGGYFDT